MPKQGRRLWIVGAGGFAAEVLHTLRGTRQPRSNTETSVAFAVEGSDEDAFMGLPVRDLAQIARGDHFVIAIGAGIARERIDSELTARGAIPLAVAAPTAEIGLGATIGDGSVLSDFTILTGNLKIGRQFQCNIYSYVAHDCVIGDYVTFAPRVCCNGNVHIGNHAYVGTGAVLKQGTPDRPLRIGAGAIVGMGAVVTKDVPDGATVIGNPAKPLER